MSTMAAESTSPNGRVVERQKQNVGNKEHHSSIKHVVDNECNHPAQEILFVQMSDTATENLNDVSPTFKWQVF